MKYLLLLLLCANICESWRRRFIMSPSKPAFPLLSLEIGITPMYPNKNGELATYAANPRYADMNQEYSNTPSEMKGGLNRHPADTRSNLNNESPSKDAGGLGRQSKYPENSKFTIVKTITTHPGMSSELGSLNRYLANPPQTNAYPNSVYPNMKFISGYSAVTSNNVLITDQNNMNSTEKVNPKPNPRPLRSSRVERTYTGSKPQECMAPTHNPGPQCAAVLIRYTYNHMSQDCEQFIYGGCNPSPNNFETYEECRATCMVD